MLGTHLALIVLLGQSPSADPSALVARLGAPRYAEREAAAGELERLGRRAIPALRAARDDRDPEIRARAAALVGRIEGALLTQPTPLTLDVEDRPLPEVLKGLSEQSGVNFALIPENAPSWQNRRVTLHESAPLPFWKAIDRLCEAAHLQYNNPGTQVVPGRREAVFPLLDGGPSEAAPTSDSGPFRVTLLNLHYERNVAFSRSVVVARGPRGVAVPPRAPIPIGGGPTPLNDGPGFHEQFYAQVQVAAEPRLAISQNGPLRIVEAIDDRGQSLLPEPADGPVTQRFSGYFGLSNGSSLQLYAPLRRPEQPGRAIRKLRGTLPIQVATRKPDPLVVPLQGAAGKSFHSDDVDLTVVDVRVNPDTNQPSIELAVRADATHATALDPAGGDGPEGLFRRRALIQRPDLHQQQIEVVDAQGRPIPWYHSSFDAEGVRMTLALNPRDHATPTELRYYGLARAATEVGFEFADVPMP